MMQPALLSYLDTSPDWEFQRFVCAWFNEFGASICTTTLAYGQPAEIGRSAYGTCIAPSTGQTTTEVMIARYEHLVTWLGCLCWGHFLQAHDISPPLRGDSDTFLVIIASSWTKFSSHHGQSRLGQIQ